MGGSAVLAELIGIVGRRLQWYDNIVAPTRNRASWTDHEELITAIEAGDADYAELLAQKHAEQTKEAYLHLEER